MTRLRPDYMWRKLRLGMWAACVMLGGNAALAQEGPSSFSETYGDWVVSCQQAQTGLFCEMSQELRQQETNQRVLRAGLVATEGGQTIGTFIVPFGLSIADGAAMLVDEDRPIGSMGFRTCIPAGCVLRTSFGEDALTTLEAGAQLQIILQRLDGAEALSISLSLTGFTAALGRLQGLAER